MRIPNVTGLSLAEAAEAYRAAGIHVIPLTLDADGLPKQPYRSNWQAEPYTGTWPEDAVGIGIPMGLNGLLGIDVDSMQPERLFGGDPELYAAIQTGAAAVSRNGRRHYLFRCSDELSNSARGLGVAHVDVRGAHGQLAAAPTPFLGEYVDDGEGQPLKDRDGKKILVPSGGVYTWAGRTVPELPQLIRDRLIGRQGESADPVTDDQLGAFFDATTEATDPGALAEAVEAFKADPQPRQNKTIGAASEVFRQARAGLFTGLDAYAAMREALDYPDPYEDDRAERLLRVAVGNAVAATVDEINSRRPDHGLVVIEPEQHESFWEQRQTLSTIRQAAKARLIGPYALLGAVLVDVLAAVDPDVELDTYGGDSASLNLFVALVGKSGAGKSRTAKAAGDVIKIDGREHWQSLRSGEGLVAAYVQKQQGQVVQVARSAVIEMDEVDRLTSLGNRQGATILSTLRTAWIGGSLGGRAASGTSDLSVQRGTYRCNLVVGVQPGRSRALLADADGGTPQRFVWLPANDPEAELGHSWPAPIAWEKVEPGVFGGGRWAPDRNLTLPDSVVAKWQQDALMRARGDGDELDAHRMLCTAKLAAGFALLEMHRDVTEDDWRLAEHLMRVSDVTRSGLLQELRRQDEQAAKAAGRLDAEREMVRAEHADSQLRTRVQEKVLRLLSEGKQPARHHFSGTQRKVLEDVLADMSDAGMIRRTDEGIQLPA